METSGTITRRLNNVIDELQNDYVYAVDDFKSKINELKKAGYKSDRPSKLKELFDMFDTYGIKYEKGKDNAYYEELVRNANIPEFVDIEDNMLYTLYSKYNEYPSPEDYMLRLVNKLCFKKDGWEKDPLRLRILKQFIKYGNYLSDAEIQGKKVIVSYVKSKLGHNPSDEDVLVYADDKVFDKLIYISDVNYDSMTPEEQKKAKAKEKDKRKYIKEKCELLKIADDLATGKFRTGGATKKYLYLFAMVYNMTYYSGNIENGEILYYEKDIEKNLFRDYYTNNLIRFISDAYDGKRCEYEVDPSGQGINYKNFAEIIYLYYISKDYEPQEKIRLSYEMIKRIQKDKFKQGKPDLKNVKRKTEYYRGVRNDIKGDLYSEDILHMTEPEFEQFILKNYDCDTYDSSYKRNGKIIDVPKGALQVETKQDTASKEYRDLVDLLSGELEEKDLTLEDCNYGLWIDDAAMLKKDKNTDRLKSKLMHGKTNARTKPSETKTNAEETDDEFAEEKLIRFKKFLLGVNDFIGYAVSDKKKASAASSDKVTRTSIIVAYYYYFNIKHEGEKGWNFKKVFESYKKDLNKILERAYYQPLSEKSILDVIAAFSSYAYLNI